MATRNPANVIEFGYMVKDALDPLGYGATVTTFSVAGATGADTEVAPGEDMEAFIELVQSRGTTIGLSEYAAGAFDVYVENSSWVVADLETAVIAIGGVFSAATVA